MKAEYFTVQNIDKVTGWMIASLTIENPREKVWSFIPEHAALLVLDMQEYFLEPGSHAFVPSAPAIIPNIEKLIGMASRLGMEVIFTKHVNTDQDAGMMNKWWKDMITEESSASEINRNIIKEEYMTGGREDWRTGRDLVIKVIKKCQYDAFYKTELEFYLQSRNINQLIITGVLTNLCCETTARSAFVRGFEVLMPLDATAAYNLEFHLGTFRNLMFGFCPLLKTSDLESKIKTNR